MRTTLIAKGPDFKAGSRISVPVGNVDLVPTILSLMGIDVPEEMDGRVLAEALEGGPDEEMVETTMRTFTTSNADGSYRAAVQVSEVLGHRYLDKAWRLGAEVRAAAESVEEPARAGARRSTG